MSKYKHDLIRKAVNRYEKIFPCGTKSDFSECFTEYKNTLFLWFNTKDNSTHVITLEMKQAP